MIGPWTYIFGFCVFFQQKKKKKTLCKQRPQRDWMEVWIDRLFNFQGKLHALNVSVW